MAGCSDVQPSIVLIGLSHHTAPIELREQVAFTNGRIENALRSLTALPSI